MQSLCVFCGSNAGVRPDYADAARNMGAAIARSGRRLVYGGGHVGLMGIVADGALAAGGEVIGVIPHALQEREVDHPGLTKLHVVASMHERKAMMAELSDGFIALPGGIGTLEELFEIWTWGQLGLHAKPYGLLNVAGYYDNLLSFLDHAATERFLRHEHREMLIVANDGDTLLANMQNHPRLPQPRWIARADT